MAKIAEGLYRFNDVLTPPSKKLSMYTGNNSFTFGTNCTNANGDKGRIWTRSYELAVNPFDEVDGKQALTLTFGTNSSGQIYAVSSAYTRLNLVNGFQFYGYVGWNDEQTWVYDKEVIFDVIEQSDFGSVVETTYDAPWKTICVGMELVVDQDYYDWFVANTVKLERTIPKGTYVFNDVITIPFSILRLTQGIEFDDECHFYSTMSDGAVVAKKVWRVNVPIMHNHQVQMGFVENGQNLPVVYVYDGRWNVSEYREAKTITITDDVIVAPDFYDVFMAITKVKAVVVRYNNEEIVTLNDNKTATLKCHGRRMKSDIVITASNPDVSMQEKTARENGEVVPDDGYDGLSKVIVNVPTISAPFLHELTVTENGEYTPDDGYDGLSKVTVIVPTKADPILQEKTVHENGWVYPDMGYDGLSAVNVEVPMPRYYGGEVEVI